MSKPKYKVTGKVLRQARTRAAKSNASRANAAVVTAMAVIVANAMKAAKVASAPTTAMVVLKSQPLAKPSLKATRKSSIQCQIGL